MKKRCRKNLASTMVTIYLSVNVEVRKDNNKPSLLTVRLVSLVPLLMLWWSARQLVPNIQTTLRSDTNRLRIGLILAGIGCRSLSWGLFGV